MTNEGYTPDQRLRAARSYTWHAVHRLRDGMTLQEVGGEMVPVKTKAWKAQAPHAAYSLQCAAAHVRRLLP